MDGHLQSFENLNKRPLGRFFKSLEREDETVAQRYAFEMTKGFVDEYRDVLHRGGVSFIAKATLAVGDVIIQTKAAHQEDTLWLELDHSRDADERFVWRLSVGHEQYDLEISETQWQCTYHEKNTQGALLRRYSIYDDETTAGLHELVRTIINHEDFKVNVQDMVEQKVNDAEELQVLATKGGRNFRETKRLAALRSAVFNAGFAAGSIDRSHIVPLLHAMNE